MLKLILLVVPLGLDTFVVFGGARAARLPKSYRLRLFASFEMAMPIVGLLLGRALGHALGH